MYLTFVILVFIGISLDLLLAFFFHKSRNLLVQLLILLCTVVIATLFIFVLPILEIGCVGQTGFGPVAEPCEREYEREFLYPTQFYFYIFPLIMLILKKVSYRIYIMFFLFLILLLVAHFVSLKLVLDFIFYPFYLLSFR